MSELLNRRQLTFRCTLAVDPQVTDAELKAELVRLQGELA